MKKQIIIELVEPNLTLPKHLQKPAEVNLQCNGFTPLEAINLLSNALNTFIRNLSVELNKNNNNTKIN